MSDLLEDLLDQIGPAGIGKISGALGSDQTSTSKAVGLALPAILGGMARNASQPEGAAALASALDDHGDGLMGALSGLLGGSGIVGHVLGQKQEPVAQQVAKGSGLDMGTVTKLLPILAPIVMKYLANQKQSRGLDASGLGAMLGQETQRVEQSGGPLGALGSLLDGDGDGIDLGDIMGAMRGGDSSGGSGMGSLLGKLLGGG